LGLRSCAADMVNEIYTGIERCSNQAKCVAGQDAVSALPVASLFSEH
jgi:hypothetical protein